MIDYESEVKGLQTPAPWFKPTVGIYQCEILEEPEFVLRKFKKETEENPDGTKMLSILLKVNGQKHQWDVGMGQTMTSIYGQLMYLGRKKNGLKGQTFTLTVKSNVGRDNKPKNEYTILEVTQMLQEEAQQKV